MSSPSCLKFLVFGVFVFCACQTIAQPILPTPNKGERPPIDLDKVPVIAYKAGKVCVKFLPAYRNILVGQTNNNKNACFGMPQLDSLSKALNVSKVKSLFPNIIKDGELASRHKAYGFDLWHELTLPDTADIKAAIKLLLSTNVFEAVEPVYNASVEVGTVSTPPLFVPTDPIFPLQWNLNNTGQGTGTKGKDIGVFYAWGISSGDPNVIVSVHDYAMNIAHPDLAQNIAQGTSFNFVDNTDSLTLGIGHGSHCSGIIAATTNNGIGMSGIAGGDGTPNSGARLMSCEIFGPNETGGGLAESLVYAADNGSVVSNNSWGYNIPDVYDLAVLDAIDYYIQYGGGNVLSGGVVAFAAGNNGHSWRIYPGAYSRVLCVAATNSQDKKTHYSNYGNWIDLTAPGGEGWFADGIYSTENTGYASSSGTSFSCPHVVGVAALVASILKRKASASDVKEIILSTTDNNYPLNPSFNNLLGTGRLNAYSALQKAQSALTKNLNPISNFTATTHCNYVGLNWVNTSANNVVVAFGTGKDIGTLADWKTYQVGDTINNGGVIIYQGNASSFNFPLIDSIVQYNFKIWGVDTNNQYSFSKTVTAYAKPVVSGSGVSVIQQDFNFPPLFPTQIWHGTDTNYDFSSWIHTANDTTSTGAGDDYSMCLYDYMYNTVLGAVDTFSGPQLNAKGADSILLSFWRAYKYSNTGKPYSDSLEVIVSTDCGNSFTSVWKKGGADLATVTDTAHTQFYPFGGIDKWKKETINLSAYNTYDKMLIGFRGYNGEGNNLFLDNINVAVRYKTNLAISSIAQPVGYYCNGNIAPQVFIKNLGDAVITKASIGWKIDNNQPIISHYTGSLARDDSAMVSLPPLHLAPGVHAFKVYTFLPNNTADNFTGNDTLSDSFTVLPVDTLPFAESFEDTLFPLAGWQMQEQPPLDNFTWLRTTSAASKGLASAFVQNFIDSFPGSIVDLLTPPINIATPVDSVFLLFDVAAATRADSNVAVPPVDTLQIDITKDCGISWATIYKRWGDSLQTVPPLYTEFVPTTGQWRTDSINLGSLVNSGDQVMFRFRDITNASNNIYLDNIRCYSKTIHSLLRQKGFLIFPNPFKNTITIQHYQPPTTLQAVAIYDAAGKRVKVFNFNEAASTSQLLDVASLQSGLYAVQLIYKDKKMVIKMFK